MIATSKVGSDVEHLNRGEALESLHFRAGLRLKVERYMLHAAADYLRRARISEHRPLAHVHDGVELRGRRDSNDVRYSVNEWDAWQPWLHGSSGRMAAVMKAQALPCAAWGGAPGGEGLKGLEGLDWA